MQPVFNSRNAGTQLRICTSCFCQITSPSSIDYKQIQVLAQAAESEQEGELVRQNWLCYGVVVNANVTDILAQAFMHNSTVKSSTWELDIIRGKY